MQGGMEQERRKMFVMHKAGTRALKGLQYKQPCTWPSAFPFLCFALVYNVVPVVQPKSEHLQVVGSAYVNCKGPRLWAAVDRGDKSGIIVNMFYYSHL